MEEIKQPLISVIIPCYNYGRFLNDCINSLLSQTYKNWECIIVDDGSIDDSLEIIRSISGKDERIRYVSQKNSGPTVARNKGLELAKGEFIQFLDADDLLEGQKFEKQISIFRQHPDHDIVYSGVSYFSTSSPSLLFDNIDLRSGPWMKNLSGKGDVMILELLNRNIMVISSPLIRKILFDKNGCFDATLSYNEDWELWLRFALKNAAFYFDSNSNTKALVRVHESYSTDNFKMFVYGLMACLKVNKGLIERKYKKIMIPKINYHKRVIDEGLIKTLSSNKAKAIEQSIDIYNKTNISRYKIYSKLFNYCPIWICYLYSKIAFLAHKLKNTIIYA